MKRRFLIGSISAAVIVILFALMWLYFSKQNLTAYAFLEKHTVASDPLFAAEEYLTEVSLDNHTILLFYLNREDTVSCAVDTGNTFFLSFAQTRWRGTNYDRSRSLSISLYRISRRK